MQKNTVIKMQGLFVEACTLARMHGLHIPDACNSALRLVAQQVTPVHKMTKLMLDALPYVAPRETIPSMLDEIMQQCDDDGGEGDDGGCDGTVKKEISQAIDRLVSVLV